jgi:hypothetical protein
MTCDPVIYPRGAIEYVYAEIESDVVLDTEPVEISLDGLTWVGATWLGLPGTTRVATALFDFGDYPRNTYKVRVRVTSLPEVPIIYVGEVIVE